MCKNLAMTPPRRRDRTASPCSPSTASSPSSSGCHTASSRSSALDPGWPGTASPARRRPTSVSMCTLDDGPVMTSAGYAALPTAPELRRSPRPTRSSCPGINERRSSSTRRAARGLRRPRRDGATGRPLALDLHRRVRPRRRSASSTAATATTHWVLRRRASAGTSRSVRLDPDVLYVDHGDVLTSAGNAAGIDLLPARRCAATSAPRPPTGSPAARSSPRGATGGQAQFIERPVPGRGRRRHRARPARGCSSTSTSRSACRDMARHARHERAHLHPALPRGDRLRPPARWLARGSASTAPGTCSRPPTCPSTGSPPTPASARRRRCASTSRPRSALLAARLPPHLPRRARLTRRAPASGHHRQVRVVRRAVLEGQDGGVLDDAVADLDGPPDGRRPRPSRGAGEHRPQEGQQRLADLPGRGVPQVATGCGRRRSSGRCRRR